MRVRVLALDYDGTIARAGVLDPDVRAAIDQVRSTGIAVVIVTGRILESLRAVAGDLRFADAVVAENGAVVALPPNRSITLAPPPSSELVHELRARGFHVDAGEAVIAAPASIAHDVLELIRDLELPLVLIFNADSLMLLPQSASKGAGLREALRLLGESRYNAIGVGDRENDHELLQACGVGVAVAWGSDALKASAQIVIEGVGPAAVAEFMRRIASKPWIPPDQVRGWLVPIGHAAAQSVALPIRNRNVIVIGDHASETSRVMRLIAEHLILNRYSTCIVDTVGCHRPPGDLQGVLTRRRGRQPARPAQVARLLERPEHSLVVDLSRSPSNVRPKYLQDLTATLAAQRRRIGWPHWMVIDASDESLSAPGLDLESGGYVVACQRPTRLDPAIWPTVEACLATRMSNPDDITSIANSIGASEHEQHWRTVLPNLLDGQAVILSQCDHPADTPIAIGLAEPLKCPARRRKPLSAPQLPPGFP